MLLQIQTAFPSFDLNADAVKVWTSFLTEADAEMAAQNLRDHIKESRFAPTIHEIVKKNGSVQARRDIEETRKMLDEQEKLRLQLPTTPPWEKEGKDRIQWFNEQIARERGKANA